MSSWTVAYGVALGAVGLTGYFATGAQHKTALIPAAIGAAEIGLGLLAGRPGLRGPAIAGAALFAVAGLGATAKALGQVPALVRGEEVERPAAVVAKAATAALSAAYLAAMVIDRARG